MLRDAEGARHGDLPDDDRKPTMATLDRRLRGLLLHITSLPGPHGIGDFGPAAYHFVDWLVAARAERLAGAAAHADRLRRFALPSVSAFAGSPLMVALEPLIERGWLAPPALLQGGFEPRRVDFARVVPWRLARLRAAAAGFRAGAAPRRARRLRRPGAPTQADWLEDYALFMALERAHGGAGVVGMG